MTAHVDHGCPFKTSPSLSFYEHLRAGDGGDHVTAAYTAPGGAAVSLVKK
jgi:hypothetical protein